MCDTGRVGWWWLACVVGDGLRAAGATAGCRTWSFTKLTTEVARLPTAEWSKTAVSSSNCSSSISAPDADAERRMEFGGEDGRCGDGPRWVSDDLSGMAVSEAERRIIVGQAL